MWTCGTCDTHNNILSARCRYDIIITIKLSRKLENDRTVDLYYGVRYGVSARFSFRPGVTSCRRRRTGYPEGGAVPPDDDGRPAGEGATAAAAVAAAAVSSAGTTAACVRVSAPRECVHVRASTLQL